MSITFNTYEDLKTYISENVGVVLRGGVGGGWIPGITHYEDTKIVILRSVDTIDYYDDDLSLAQPLYTFSGSSGDQCITKGINARVLDTTKTDNIYLYGVETINTQRKLYTWYGEVDIKNIYTKRWRGCDGLKRTIYLMELEIL
jgi:imidazole glycerol phosphate synthase subunit HisF